MDEPQTIIKDDDWEISLSVENVPLVPVPSFIRLFVVRRTLKYCKFNPDIESLRNLTNVFRDPTTQHTANLILYMKKYYKEKEQSQLIESIMNQIIFIKFAQQYQQQITFKASTTQAKYQEIVFNTSDLMCNIFQHFAHVTRMRQTWINCSLVSSHWLYHAWNVNSVHYVYFYDILLKTVNQQLTQGNDNSVSRVWQRLINVQSICLPLYYGRAARIIPTDDLLQKFSLLRNIKVIDV